MDTDQKKKFIDSITQVIKGEQQEWNDKDAHYPVEHLEKALKSIGLTKVDLEVNGWQCDWWLNVKNKQGQRFTLFGSGYYGGLNFSHATEV